MRVRYIVPASAASKFEKAVRSLLPQLFADQPDLLYQLLAMVAPADLRAQVRRSASTISLYV